MIESISIQNFRCYRNTQIKGFKRFNLIGGLNNSGKTILLEAIFLNNSPLPNKFLFLKELHNNFKDPKFPEFAWDIFLNKNKQQNEIIINSLVQRDTPPSLFENKTRFVCTKISDTSFFSEQNLGSANLSVYYNDEQKTLFELKSVKGDIHISEEHYLPKKTFIKTFYIPTRGFVSSTLVNAFSLALQSGEKECVLAGLKIIDKDINDIQISTINGNHLEIQRRGESFMDISFFGDALNKILIILLSVINNKSAILLIDEIENGLHHTVQRDFWKFLFILSQPKHFDIQLFATTHSLEMLRAFKDVALTEFSEDAAYIELFLREKGAEKQEIHYNLHKMDTLDFEINSQIPVRGE